MPERRSEALRSAQGDGFFYSRSARDGLATGKYPVQTENTTAHCVTALPSILSAPSMPSAADHRQAPHVPNHEMVRSIGRGSYGEIWLARSLTGTWRAVKIVDRRTFESDKAFLREFEGMSKFEPISRGDSGFVDILHVGRDESGGVFYYVMELADDHLACGPGDPQHYN